jgi:hypothetical protein
LILYFFLSQIFLVIPLILIANLVPTLSAIFKGLFYNLKYLVFLYSYTLIVLYIFSWIGFLFLPHLFRFEVVDKNNEVVTENQETIEENVAVADSIPNADAAADDAEAAAVGMTDGASDATVSTSNAIVEITDPATQIEGDGVHATPEIESASDVAALESLRRTLSREDVEDTSASGGADVELDVKTNDNDLNIQMDGKSTTLTPNEDGGEAPAEDTGAAEGGEEPPAEGGEEAPAEGGEEEGGAEGGEGGEEEEAAESWNYFL